MLTISTLRSVSYYTEEISEVFGYYNDDKAKAESALKPQEPWKGEEHRTQQNDPDSSIKGTRRAPPWTGNGLLDLSECPLADDTRGRLAMLLPDDASADLRAEQGNVGRAALRRQPAERGNLGNGAIVTRSDQLLEEERQARDRRDPPGEWAGEFARQIFGDEKCVTQEDFAALFFGIHPRTGKALTKTADHDGFELFKIEAKLKTGCLTPVETKRLKRHVGEIKGRLKAKEQAQQRKHDEKIKALEAQAKTLFGEAKLAVRREIDALKRGRSAHRAGVDLTFSAPKDFSLLAAAATPEQRRELLDAWKRAVAQTLEGVEAKYARTRRRDEAGTLQSEKIRGAAFGLFEHLSARPVGDNVPDPDAHIHAIMFSPVHCFDEETRALWTNEIRLNMKVIGAEARARLAVELSRMGYGVIEDKQKSITSFHLQGIAPEDRAHFSKRADQVRQRMEAGDFGKSSVATLATREGKGDWTRSDCLKAWSAEFAARGLSETAIRASQPKAPRRERSDQDIIDGLLEMQAHFSARDVRKAVWEEMQFASLPAGADIGQLANERINRILKSPELLQAQLPDGSMETRQRTANADSEPVFTTRSLVRREIQLDKDVEELGRRMAHKISWDRASKIIEEIEAQKTEEARAQNPNAKPFRFRDDQRAASAQILAGADVAFLQAFAGTGKTTAAAAIFAVYKRHGMKVVALAPSNKAAKQLSDDCKLTGDESARTIDAFLLNKNALAQVDSQTVIFVDEASMVSFDAAEKLIRVAKERGAKIIWQGDKEQLPSVQRGRFFAHAVEQRIGADAAELTVINRQWEDYARRATEAAAKGDFAQTLDLLDAHGKIHTEGTDEAVLERLARDHLADPQPPAQKLIVASRNADVDVLNRKIRQALVEQGKIEAGSPALLIDKDGKARTIGLGRGDRIIFTDTLKQGRSVVAANGSLATVQLVQETATGLRVVVLLDGASKPIEFNTADFGGIAYGHAISIHKSQGQTVESARFYFSEFISSELAYVGLSRHRGNVGLYCRQDQREYLAQFMGRKLEKLSARDLISSSELAALESDAQTARQRDADWHAKTWEHITKRLPALGRLDAAKLCAGSRALLAKGKGVVSTLSAMARRIEARAALRKREEQERQRQELEARQKREIEAAGREAARPAVMKREEPEEQAPTRRRRLRF